MRDPTGGELLTSGEKTHPTGGPLGTIIGFVGFAVIVVVFVGTFVGLEELLQLVVPQWALFPLTVLSLAVLVVVAFASVIRTAEWWRTR
jgi:uncharacterized membrane protein